MAFFLFMSMCVLTHQNKSQPLKIMLTLLSLVFVALWARGKLRHVVYYYLFPHFKTSPPKNKYVIYWARPVRMGKKNVPLVLSTHPRPRAQFFPIRTSRPVNNIYIYLIDQARGPSWENIGPRSWQYKKDRGPIFSQYGPEQAWLIRDLLYDWRKLWRFFKKCGIIRDNAWSNT